MECPPGSYVFDIDIQYDWGCNLRWVRIMCGMSNAATGKFTGVASMSTYDYDPWASNAQAPKEDFFWWYNNGFLGVQFSNSGGCGMFEAWLPGYAAWWGYGVSFAAEDTAQMCPGGTWLSGFRYVYEDVNMIVRKLYVLCRPVCTICPVNTFMRQLGADSCSQCAYGSRSPVGSYLSSQCVCPAGTYMQDEVCMTCFGNSYCPVCMPCRDVHAGRGVHDLLWEFLLSCVYALQGRTCRTRCA